MQFGKSKQDKRSSPFVLICASGKLGKQVEDFGYFPYVSQLRAVLSQDPRDDLKQSIWDVWVFLKYLHVDFNGTFPELFAILIPLVLTDGPNKLVNQVFFYLVSSNLEQSIHSPNVPVLVGSEVFTQVADFLH